MPEPLESEPAGVTLESDALPQEDFPPGDVRRRPEAPGNSYLGQAAAVPTSGQPQVANEDLSINSFEVGGGEALQPPAPSFTCPQTAPTATADGVMGVHFQQTRSTAIDKFARRILDFINIDIVNKIQVTRARFFFRKV
jgi:hypothetical protein